MKKFILFMSIFAFSISSVMADPPQRKVIQAPQKPQVVRNQPREFTRPPTARPTIPGKQQWQKPQQQPEQPKVQPKHSFGFYNYYRPNPHFRYYRAPSYYPPVIVQPPVIIQPQPMPIYPAPFHGFFFHFRF
tara:strand:+ start:836 stop:1231 length:396 start_codon:yes stop_codon:yes gene_type:complete